jgi:Flp pilus assembly pilin Flp
VNNFTLCVLFLSGWYRSGRGWDPPSSIPSFEREYLMLRAFAFLQNFVTAPVRRDDRGVTAVEYALLLSIIGAVLLACLVVFGHALSAVFKGFTF